MPAEPDGLSQPPFNLTVKGEVMYERQIRGPFDVVPDYRRGEDRHYEQPFYVPDRTTAMFKLILEQGGST